LPHPPHSVAYFKILVSKTSFGTLVNLAVLAVGIALRTAQFASNTSLSLDEIALAKGILSFDLPSLLTRQLPFDQIAPRGFLLIQKLAVLTLGPSDYVLRFVPFVCSLAALVAFSRLAQRALPPVGALVATVLFATAPLFIAFAGIGKQYSIDVCVAVLLSLLAFDLITRPVTARKTWQAAIVGATLPWFSQTAVLVTVGLTCPLILWMSTNPPDNRRRRIVIVVAIWAASALAVTASSLATMSPATRDYMRMYWADGFAPASLGSTIGMRWLWTNIRNLFGSGHGAQAGLGYPLSPLYPVLAVLGFGVLWRQRRPTAVMLLGPIILTLGAAVAGQYPFSGRLILFLVPSAILAIAAAIGSVHHVVTRCSKRAAAWAVMALAMPAVVQGAISCWPPYGVEAVKGVLEHVRSNWQPGDSVYVYYGAAPAMSMYDSEYGLSRGAYAVGGCHRGDNRRYLAELDTFRGSSRLWIVLIDAPTVSREREDILAYLNAIGTRLDSVTLTSRALGRPPSRAQVYLYDLSATLRLANANAHSFKLTGRQGKNPRHPCVNGPLAMIQSDFDCTGAPNTRCTRRPVKPPSEIRN